MSQAYYILKPAVNTEETGQTYPAVESYDNYDFDGPNSVHKIKSRDFPDFEPDIRFKLAKGAKLCDMMGQATINASGFLISEKLKAFFEGVNSVPKKFYPATIEANGEFHLYYWMHLVWKEAEKLIDYENSMFFKRKFSNNLGTILLTSAEDFWRKKEELGGRYLIGIEKLTFKNIPEYDIIPIPFKTDIIVSGRIKDQLNDFKGLELFHEDYLNL